MLYLLFARVSTRKVREYVTNEAGVDILLQVIYAKINEDGTLSPPPRKKLDVKIAEAVMGRLYKTPRQG